MARPFVVCKISSCITGCFWFDNCTSLCPLIEQVGTNAPRLTGLDSTATVRDALVGNQWWLSSSRSRNPVILFLQERLPDPSNIFKSEEDDRYLWQIGGNFPTDKFSSFAMWNHMNNQSPSFPWSKSVWFKGMIPKHSFVSWLASHNKLLTRDRMSRWKISVSQQCFLCNNENECRQHIFFDYPLSKEVWQFFYSKLQLSPPLVFDEGLRWIKDRTRDSNVNLILRLAYQASLYTIWKERNSRLHSQVSRPAASLIAEIQGLIQANLDSLSRKQHNLPSTVTYLST